MRLRPEMIGECALCQNRATLERSHIIPNAFFRRIKPQGRVVQLEPDTPAANRYAQYSWHEHLLCVTCEDRIRLLERYAIGVIFEPERYGVTRQAHKNLSERWASVNYTKFRLFLLSILYRAAMAKGEAFKNVYLDSAEASQLRSALLNNAPLPPRIMGCTVLVLVNPHRRAKLDKLVNAGAHDIVQGRRQFVFVFGGYVWEFYLPKLPLKPYKPGHYLNESGFMICPAVSMWTHPIVGKALAISYEKEYLGQGVIKRKE